MSGRNENSESTPHTKWNLNLQHSEAAMDLASVSAYTQGRLDPYVSEPGMKVFGFT
jgi:hypothetical protein